MLFGVPSDSPQYRRNLRILLVAIPVIMITCLFLAFRFGLPEGPDQPTLSEDDRVCLEEGMEERIMLEGYNLEILQLCQELETEVWSGLLVCGRAWTGVHPVRDCEGQKRFNALITEQLVTDISEFRAACLADVSCEAAARGGLNYDWWHLETQPPN